VPVSGESGTTSPDVDVGEHFGGEADAHVPAISATISPPVLIIDSWNCRPQLLAEVGDTTRNMTVFLAPHVPSELQIVTPDFLVGSDLAVLVEKSLNRRRQIHEISNDLFTSSGILETSLFL
jgi:hypothetical protein